MEDWKQIEEIVRGCEIDMTDPRNISAAIMIEGEEDGVHMQIWNAAVAEVMQALKKKFAPHTI